MKGEGEVKLNMTVGKGEQVLKHSRIEEQETISSQLQNLKDAWANMLMTAMSCHRYETFIHPFITLRELLEKTVNIIHNVLSTLKPQTLMCVAVII